MFSTEITLQHSLRILIGIYSPASSRYVQKHEMSVEYQGTSSDSRFNIYSTSATVYIATGPIRKSYLKFLSVLQMGSLNGFSLRLLQLNKRLLLRVTAKA